MEYRPAPLRTGVSLEPAQGSSRPPESAVGCSTIPSTLSPGRQRTGFNQRVKQWLPSARNHLVGRPNTLATRLDLPHQGGPVIWQAQSERWRGDRRRGDKRRKQPPSIRRAPARKRPEATVDPTAMLSGPGYLLATGRTACPAPGVVVLCPLALVSPTTI